MPTRSSLLNYALAILTFGVLPAWIFFDNRAIETLKLYPPLLLLPCWGLTIGIIQRSLFRSLIGLNVGTLVGFLFMKLGGLWLDWGLSYLALCGLWSGFCISMTLEKDNILSSVISGLIVGLLTIVYLLIAGVFSLLIGNRFSFFLVFEIGILIFLWLTLKVIPNGLIVKRT